MEKTRTQDWLNRHRLGDPAAKDELIAHCCDQLGKKAKKQLKRFPSVARWERTDDVLQKAVIRLHSTLDDVQPESVKHLLNLGALQIRRTLIDLKRHYQGPEGLGAKHQTDGDRREQDGGAAANASAEPETLEEWTEFHTAVEQLPDESREIVDLYFYQDLSHQEVAELLDITERTSKRRWRAAKEQLQQLIIEQADE